MVKIERWLALALLLTASCAAAGATQEMSADGSWPRTLDSGGSTLVIYEPSLESLRGNRLTARAAASLTRPDSAEPLFGSVWLDEGLIFDTDQKTARTLVVHVTDLRFPGLSGGDAADLKQDIENDSKRWALSYDVNELMADLKQVEEQKALAKGIKAEVPRILFLTRPATLLSMQGQPAWRAVDNSPLQRLENSASFVVRDPATETCYLCLPPFWWTAKDPVGAWEAAESVPDAVAELAKREGPPAREEEKQRPTVIPTTGAMELVWTDGEPQYAAISGTELIYVRNTDSDVFLHIPTQTRYALFSGRWYRTPMAKESWEFVESDKLPADFAHIPVGSEKQHVLACVAGTPQAVDALKSAEVPVTEAVKPGPAPELKATYDGEPQFTEVPEAGVSYAVNTPYSIFYVDDRYYWCNDGIWYDAAFAVGPWFVCARVPRPIYLIPPSCPHYYVTYCHVFNATPSAIYVGYYPGYRGCYAWGGSVVYGTGWSYRPWVGNYCYTRPVTWGVGVHYSPVSSGWSVGVGFRHSNYRRAPVAPPPVVHAGAGGYWGGGASPRPGGVSSYRRSPPPSLPNSRPNLYGGNEHRVAPPATPTRPPSSGGYRRAPTPDQPPVKREPGPVQPPKMPDPHPRRDDPKTPPPSNDEPRRTPPKMPDPRPRQDNDHDQRRTPPKQEEPKAPPRRTPPRMPDPSPRRDEPKTPPPKREEQRTPPPPRKETPPPAPKRETPPPPREAPRKPPPPERRGSSKDSEKSERRR